MSSPAPAQAVQRPLTHASSLSSSARECIYPTQPAVPPSGAAAHRPLLTPLTVKAARVPAWANSLFEDNAEHGLGLALGQKTIREKLIGYVKELDAIVTDEAKKAVIAEYLNTLEDGEKNTAATQSPR